MVAIHESVAAAVAAVPVLGALAVAVVPVLGALAAAQASAIAVPASGAVALRLQAEVWRAALLTIRAQHQQT